MSVFLKNNHNQQIIYTYANDTFTIVLLKLLPAIPQNYINMAVFSALYDWATDLGASSP